MKTNIYGYWWLGIPYREQKVNVIAVGIPILGPMSKLESKAFDIRPITQLMIHEKFVSPYMYDNVGLVQITPPITNTPMLQPICFPFLASVLDILHFRGFIAKTLGFDTPGIFKIITTLHYVTGTSNPSKYFQSEEKLVSSSCRKSFGSLVMSNAPGSLKPKNLKPWNRFPVA